jgi:tRNA threonylcarbamoyladenosine biosynthesis protein TsaB
MTCILALDTATAACSVALASDDGVIARCEVLQRGHAERLLPMVADVMREAGCRFAALDAIAVTIGPGAFTGLRIGLAAARGLALATGSSCFGVGTLEAIAADVEVNRGASRLLVVLDSKRGDAYAQLFRAGSAVVPPQVARLDELAALVGGEAVAVAGDMSEAAAAALRAAGISAQPLAGRQYPQAAAVARLACRRWQAGERPQAAPRPLYLRAPDTGPPLAAATPLLAVPPRS